MAQTNSQFQPRTKVFLTVAVIAIFMFGMLYTLTRHKPAAKAINETPAAKMQDFVMAISKYAKRTKPGFIIIPQNGIELGFEDANPKKPTDNPYLDAIDAFGAEELFYYEKLNVDDEKLEALRKLQPRKKILVSDFIKDDDDADDAKARNKKEGFIPFLRSASNYNYQKIPQRIVCENNNDVYSMKHVRNYLYLINPGRYDNKEEFIAAIRKTNFDMVVIDLYFDNDDPMTPEDINLLREKANGGKRIVLSYMNIGAAENWRYYWKRSWKLHSPEFLERQYPGYDNEVWVNYWDKQWQNIIYGNESSYVKRIIDAGFDGTYLDNTEAYLELYKKSPDKEERK